MFVHTHTLFPSLSLPPLSLPSLPSLTSLYPSLPLTLSLSLSLSLSLYPISNSPSLSLPLSRPLASTTYTHKIRKREKEREELKPLSLEIQTDTEISVSNVVQLSLVLRFQIRLVSICPSFVCLPICKSICPSFWSHFRCLYFQTPLACPLAIASVHFSLSSS